ncbi:hypothetical protein D035_0166 [Vibrio parahaemolyticus VP250]|nr:hypothetical protein D035_0166 [Vibrio parahaemolyticus VP250]
MFIILNILRNASDVVVVPAPDEPVTAMIGCLADMTNLVENYVPVKCSSEPLHGR